MQESNEGEREEFEGFDEENLSNHNEASDGGYESDSLSSLSTSSLKTTSSTASSSYNKHMSIGIEGVLAPKPLNGKEGYYLRKVMDFRKRTFKMEWEMHFFTDDVRITVEADCVSCER